MTTIAPIDAAAELLRHVTAAVDRWIAGDVADPDGRPHLTFRSDRLDQTFMFAVDPAFPIADRRDEMIAAIHGEVLFAYLDGRDDHGHGEHDEP